MANIGPNKKNIEKLLAMLAEEELKKKKADPLKTKSNARRNRKPSDGTDQQPPA